MHVRSGLRCHRQRSQRTSDDQPHRSDGGASWVQQSVPSGLTFATSANPGSPGISCPSALDCFAVLGYENGPVGTDTNLLLNTTNGRRPRPPEPDGPQYNGLSSITYPNPNSRRHRPRRVRTSERWGVDRRGQITPLAVTTSSLPDGVTGDPYSASFAAETEHSHIRRPSLGARCPRG